MEKKKIVFTTIVAIFIGSLFFNAIDHSDGIASTIPNNKIVPVEEITLLPNIENVDHKSTHAERISRQSSVKVYHPNFQGFGSGTYFKSDGRFFILTAAHVVRGESVMMILGRDEVAPARVIYSNEATDIAFLELDALHSRVPVRFKTHYDPHVSDYIAYTGFPNGTDLLTITGRVSGFRGQWLIVQGYTWMGASGSGIFDSRGRLIGVVSMVEVGNFHGPQIIEDVVYVAKLNEKDVKNFRGIISKDL
ncbi:serine protease [bacterium]|nr:serine protease [bacterium]